MTVEELERDLSLKAQDNANVNDQRHQYQQHHQRSQFPLMHSEQFINQIQQQRFQQQQAALLAGGGGLENIKISPEFQGMDPMVVAAMMHHAAYVQQNLMLRQHQHQQQQDYSNRNPIAQSKPLVRFIINNVF